MIDDTISSGKEMEKPDYREPIKRENRKKILQILIEKGNLPFQGLLEETGFARSTLARHLKYLTEKGEIEKFYNIYRVTKKTVLEAQAEAMINYLGKIATHQIARTKLNLPLEFDINREMEYYMKGEPKSFSWKELFDYLQEKHPLEI